MPPASLHAQVCDLLGFDPQQSESEPAEAVELTGRASRVIEACRLRPTIAEALKACPRGAVMRAHDQGEQVAVVVLEDGRGCVMRDVCPHDGGRLSDGFVEAGRLVCARHGWTFDPVTGERVG